MWFTHETKNLSSPQVFNDSKTPSGKVHVGSLRGVIIHDALYRACLSKGIESTFLYGLDDMDPLDGLPENAGDELKQQMGKPLCKVAAPADSSAANLAEHYAADFLATFEPLGVNAQIYRTSDFYLSGKFDEAIEQILNNAAIVREVYRSVSNSLRPDNWYPFQVICESCGNIGSTQVSDFDGKEVTYSCIPNYTSWANGCGHKGKVSPYNGNGKLVWKLEWVAKWATLGITFESAGKDHCTKGGSRDVSNVCFSRIFKRPPPKGFGYEFFLVEGSKMSSSKGVGASAESITQLLPPGLMRFLMINTLPKRTVNFSTDQEFFVKLFNNYDKICHSDSEANIALAQQTGIHEPSVRQPVGFQLLLALLQLPHIDVLAEINKRYQLNKEQLADLKLRIESAKNWLDNFALAEDRITVHEQPPESLKALSASQAQLLQTLAKELQSQGAITDDQMQQLIFDCARLVPCSPRDAFIAVYRAFLDSENGPKAGSLLAYLPKDFVLKRLESTQVDISELWQETGKQVQDIINELSEKEIDSTKLETVTHKDLHSAELTVKLSNGQTTLRRTLPQSQQQAEEASQQLQQAFNSK